VMNTMKSNTMNTMKSFSNNINSIEKSTQAHPRKANYLESDQPPTHQRPHQQSPDAVRKLKFSRIFFFKKISRKFSHRMSTSTIILGIVEAESVLIDTFSEELILQKNPKLLVKKSSKKKSENSLCFILLISKIKPQLLQHLLRRQRATEYTAD
jgi:hypothetical protein